MPALRPITISDIQEARKRLRGQVLHTPLLLLDALEPPASISNKPRQGKIYLKLENLQPTGSFKIRGAGNAMLSMPPERLSDGVWTASAGNMGLNLAWFAYQQSIPCRVIVPQEAPQVKVNALERLNAQVIRRSFSEYQQIQCEPAMAQLPGLLVHPFADTQVMAGNAAIVLEILEDQPEVQAIFAPYGGGGLCCGLAAALQQIAPQVQLIACEVETGAPLTASLLAGKPVEVNYSSSFISGMGAPFVFPQMWQLASQLLQATCVVSLEEVKQAIRLLAETQHVIAEGAGAVALAAALKSTGLQKIACIISGGNIDRQTLIDLLKEKC